MALSDEQIHDCFQQKCRDKRKERRLIAEAIEAEVRKDDEALIRQMLDAAIAIYPHLNGLAVASDQALLLLQQQIAAITAARSRLEKAP